MSFYVYLLKHSFISLQLRICDYFCELFHFRKVALVILYITPVQDQFLPTLLLVFFLQKRREKFLAGDLLHEGSCFWHQGQLGI